MKQQEPLFGCCQCYEDYSWPASDLYVYNDELWCESCWEETDMHHNDGIDLSDLTPFVPKYQKTIDSLRQRAEKAEAENVELRSGLIRLRDCDFVISLPGRMDAVRDIAKKALADTSPITEAIQNVLAVGIRKKEQHFNNGSCNEADMCSICKAVKQYREVIK